MRSREFRWPNALSTWRMGVWFLLSLPLLVFVGLSFPQQLEVLVNKLLLVSISAWLGYWISVSALPSARPGYLLDLLAHTNTDGKSPNDWELLLGKLAASSMLSRAIIMGTTMLAVALGL
jgi:hypothetical protein